MKRKSRHQWSAKEIVALEKDVAQSQRGEAAWQQMTAATSDEDDSWNAVEEHLLSKSSCHAHSERRWKYFSK